MGTIFLTSHIPIFSDFSAGVGRSGTFVVLDTLLQRIKTHDTVDIFNAVTELRKDRVWMVQTEVRYFKTKKLHLNRLISLII